MISSQEWAEQECDQNDGAGGEDKLPLTGTSTALIAGGAVVLLLALGGGMFLLARRRWISLAPDLARW